MVLAGLVVPAVATCGGEVEMHRRPRIDEGAIYFWRRRPVKAMDAPTDMIPTVIAEESPLAVQGLSQS